MRARPVRFSVSTGLRLCGMAEEPFWPGEKYSSASSTSVRCRWRISVASRSIEEATTPSVAKYMAWRSRGMTWVETGSTASPICSATYSSTRGSILAKVPTAPEIAQVAISALRRDQPQLAALELGIGLRELEAEGGRLGMDAVAAADGRRHLVLEGAALERGEQRVDIGDQQVGGALELDGEAGVEHVGRGHALVDEARFGADDLGEMGEEGDDVVLHLALDLVDPLDVEGRLRALLPDQSRPPPSAPRRARPERVVACASISNQMRNLVSGDQMATISGRL